MLYSELGLEEGMRKDERVAILVGPNGAGKSRFLFDLAQRNRHYRKVAIISNTAYDRFSGLRGVERISAGKGFNSPISIIKRCVQRTFAEMDSRFYQIGSVLEYCHYKPQFGFRVKPGKRGDRKRSTVYYENDIYRNLVDNIERGAFSDIFWIDAASSGTRFSYRADDVQALLSFERDLRRDRVVRGIDVYLERDADGRTIELHRASSGELSLMSSMIFLVANVIDDGVVIVDEPENSLHPNWQREYIDTVLTTLRYRDAVIVVATHAPLVVTGAIAQNPGMISVFQVENARPKLLKLDTAAAGGSIEEMLWKAFDVVTPVSHFVSEELVGAVSRFEAGDTTKAEVLDLIAAMKEASFDRKQEAFLEAVSKLVDDLDKKLTAGSGVS